MVRSAVPLFLALILASIVACKKTPQAPADAGAVAPRAPAPAAWREGLKSTDPNERAKACRSILPTELPASPPELVAALGDSQPVVRKAAIAGILGFILSYADASALSKLLELAEKDPVTDVRAAAVRAIGALSHRDVVSSLAKIFPNEKDEAIRDEMLSTFARLADQRAVPVLLPLLKGKFPPPLTFEALRRIGDAQTVPALLPLLDNESGAVRSRAIQVLGQIGAPAAVPKLVRALLDKDPGVVSEAIKAVAIIGAPEGVAALLKLCDHSDPEVRRRAIHALATYRNPESISLKDALPIVLRHLKTDAPRVRVEAARVLGTMRIFEALPGLQEAATATNPREVRVAALDALGQIGDPKALPFLTTSLSDKDPDVRTIAAKAIGSFGKKGASAAPALAAAWKRNERDIDARIEIVRALGRLGAPAATEVLLEAAQKDPVPLVRVEAAGSLLRLGKEEGVAALRPILLGATDWQERRAAAKVLDPTSDVSSISSLLSEALEREGEPLVREELYRKLGQAVGEVSMKFQRKALAEPVPVFRLMAADGLCGNGEPEGCKALIKALADPDASVRSEAAQRVGKLEVQEALDPLRKLAEDPVLWVASEATRAIKKIEAAAKQ
jgi:HEAT repeat protein